MLIMTHLKKLSGILSVKETVSRLNSLRLSRSSEENPSPCALLTENEVQSLREEMMRDGARMREWLSSKLKYTRT
jgi:hypothetical protein